MRCAADWPARSVYRTLNLPQGGPQILGANLNCSESEALRGVSLIVPDQHSTGRWGRRRGCPNHAKLYQASVEHFQQCAEFPLFCNRGLGALSVTVLPVALTSRAAATACAAVQPAASFFVAGTSILKSENCCL
jgi:hypothetical protein